MILIKTNHPCFRVGRHKKFLKNYPGNFTLKNSKRRECFIFTVAMGRRCLLTVITMTGPACQQPKVAIGTMM
jgi:hypothetical protein